MSRDRDFLVGTASAVIAATLFGMLGPLARFGADAGVAGVAFTAWRALLGVAFVGVLIAVRGGVRPSMAALRNLSTRGRASLALAGTMGLALNASIFTAFGLIPIALALMLFYTYPAGVVVVDVVLGRERITPSRLLALGLSSVGVALVLFGGAGSAATAINPLGVALGLCAAASQVVFVTVSRSGYRTVPSDAATLVNLAVSVVGATVIAIAVGQTGDLLAPLRSLEPLPILVLAGVVAAGLSSLLFLTAIRTLGGTRTGILMLLEPVVGAILAGLWLGETLAPIQFAGGGLVLLGALVLQLRSDPDLEPVTEAGASPVV
ncbi:MAG TPA: DMT family transporter [Candidatus Limnocylindrales bacterium]|jgi:drug/metabolite transporter (DMT)-like permease